jgi:trimeric autotransporter adhesin
MKTCRFLAAFLCLGATALLTSCGGSSGTTGGGGGNGGNGGGSGSPAPAVTSISPTSVTAGSGNLTLTVNGSGFLSTTTVQVGGAAEQTAYVSTTQITATIPASQLASGAQLPVVALNGSSSSGSGTPINLQVTNPSPTITSVTPNAVLAGAASATIQVIGTGFVPTTQIQVNGGSRTTVFVSATQVNVTLSASDIAAASSLSLTAVNAAPGGGTSTAATVAVNNPMPVVTGLTPYAVVTGAGASTITVKGAYFVAASTVTVNGASVPTTFVSSTQLTFSLANQTTAQVDTVAVTNPAPGGGTASAGTLGVLAPTAAPVISSVLPTQFVAGSAATYIDVDGSNFAQQVGTSAYYVTSTVLWNGTPLTTASSYYTSAAQELVAEVPASLLTTVGSATVTVTSTVATPSTSNAVTVPIVNPPPPTLTSLYPSGSPINTATSLTLYGTGFISSSTVAVNGINVPSQFVGSTELTATIPASAVAVPGNVNVTVTTPAPGGGTTAPYPFTAYIEITNNDIAYNPSDGLLYASVPGSVPTIGNSVVGIDPVTGNVARQIWVGSNPNKLALSTDDTQLFVGLDGAASVAQVSLATGKVVNQFSLGGGPGVYNPPLTAFYMTAVPGSPNSVAVATSTATSISSGVTIYDSGVARANTSASLYNATGPLCFGSTSSTLYMSSSSGVVQFTVGLTGITASSVLNPVSIYSYPSGNIQYDNGNIYLSNGEVLNATTGALLGTFYATTSTAASGPVVSDSTLGLAFIAGGGTQNGGSQVLAFNESSFNPSGNITFYGLNSGAAEKIVRWGQNGVALNSTTQIFIFQSPVVKDLSSTPADLAISLTAPQTATTGNAISYVATVKNLGPNPAVGTTLAATLDSSLIVNSITPSQGTCGTGSAFTCDLGGLANGTSATVMISATPTTAGTFAGSAVVSSISYDPATTNNQSTSSTTITGSFYAMAPSVTSISPALVQTGSGAFTLTVNGNGFNANSTVNIGGSAMVTTYVSTTQLSANVTANSIANYGWAPVTVTNASPGGGTSAVLPLTIYAVVNVPANAVVFDPFSQNIYATIPSASTTVTGNSIVAINPATGAVGSPISIGSQPTVMAETSDGNYLYVGLAGSDSLAQFDLVHQTVVATTPIQYDSSDVTATYLAAMPGTDSTLAINFTNSWDNFGILDISGNTGTFRPNLSGIYEGVDPIFASPTEIYAYDSETSGAEFYRYSVNSSGLTLIDGTTLDGMGGYQGGFDLAGGLVYGGAGGIVNPSTTPPSQIAILSLPEFYEAGITEFGVGAVADPSTQQDFIMMENAAGTWEYGLASFSTNTYLPETTFVMPASASNIESTWTMLRWGQAGLALLSVPEAEISPQATTQLLLLEGPFVTPQLLTTNSAASLTSSSTTSLTHGAGNTVLTLTGSNFKPGVAVTWNGSYRTTTIVDVSHVTVAIPASDLVNAGSGSLVATNPGASASNALTITIN